VSDEKENVDIERDVRQQGWFRLRGALKDVYGEYGGGEAYLRKERQEFNEAMERREALIAMPLSEKNKIVVASGNLILEPRRGAGICWVKENYPI
jgi:hypothetical protein